MAHRKIQLLDQQMAIVLSLPESGMGYHLVDLLLRDGSVLQSRVILNSEFLVLQADEDISPGEIIRITRSNNQNSKSAIED